MIADDLLFATIIAGLGLSLAYVRAELTSRRRLRAAELRREIVQRELHIKEDRLPLANAPPPAAESVFSDLGGFACDELAY